MIKKILAAAAVLCVSASLSAQTKVHVCDSDDSGLIIPKEIYGHFSEHLGSCIYGGIWVGEDSEIPNISGYRKDVLEALKALEVPVLRWPGGCFADDYHWMDGIGPREQRAKISNNNWGGTMEDNSFGTHEFLNFCELIGAQPYISGNVGSGTAEELAKWVEYMTSDSQSTVANMRRANGRDKAWDVKYLGIGNEAWGCGGNMRPEYYSDLQFMFGPSILVCPITEPGVKEWKVYLPKSDKTWYDLINGTGYDTGKGGMYVTVPASLDYIPVFGLGEKFTSLFEK